MKWALGLPLMQAYGSNENLAEHGVGEEYASNSERGAGQNSSQDQDFVVGADYGDANEEKLTLGLGL